MKEIILDFGSGNTCKNDFTYVSRMINKLEAADSKQYRITIKWQLFKKAGNNISLNRKVFDYAYALAESKGYETTASVFDFSSLEFLLSYSIPFVKLSNNRSTHFLIDYIPKNVPIYISSSNEQYLKNSFPKRAETMKHFFCISKYPASIEEYEELDLYRGCNISDHTVGFELWDKYDPSIIEWHYRLEDSTGLDAGHFAKTPNQLKVVI